MKNRLWSLIAILPLMITSVRANDLAIGKFAKSNKPINIPLVQPIDLNFKTRDEIFRLRKQEIMKHPELLMDAYTPSDEVFGQVENKKPWWGVLGEGYYGPGQNSIRGASEESRFILNPYLLVGESMICGLNKSRYTENDIINRHVPMFYQPSNLKWYPKDNRAEVIYEVTAYKNQMCALLGFSNWRVSPNISLEAINARDLGLKYFYIPTAWATSINFSKPMDKPMAVPHFIHCGGSCDYPGGCNNMSPHFPQLDEISFTRLPASISICFWKNPPTTAADKADMIYTLTYR
jgi:hypothetical protein